LTFQCENQLGEAQSHSNVPATPLNSLKRKFRWLEAENSGDDEKRGSNLAFHDREAAIVAGLSQVHPNKKFHFANNFRFKFMQFFGVAILVPYLRQLSSLIQP